MKTIKLVKENHKSVEWVESQSLEWWRDTIVEQWFTAMQNPIWLLLLHKLTMMLLSNYHFIVIVVQCGITIYKLYLGILFSEWQTKQSFKPIQIYRIVSFSNFILKYKLQVVQNKTVNDGSHYRHFRKEIVDKKQWFWVLGFICLMGEGGGGLQILAKTLTLSTKY